LDAPVIDTPQINKKPESWAEAMAQYHEVKPGIAAMLEHAICQSFDDNVSLLLSPHQLESLNQETRQHFAQWLGKDVSWQERRDEAGESLLEQKQREKEAKTRQLWKNAEADPHVQALKHALNCRLVDVLPPSLPPNLPTDDKTLENEASALPDEDL